MKVFWMYELHKGQGVFQGSTGPGAEGTIRRVVQMTKDEMALRPSRAEVPPGEPFVAFMPEATDNGNRRADDQMLRDSGFESARQLLEAYRVLAESENAARRRIDGFVELLTQLRPIIKGMKMGLPSGCLSAQDLAVLRKLDGKL